MNNLLKVVAALVAALIVASCDATSGSGHRPAPMTGNGLVLHARGRTHPMTAKHYSKVTLAFDVSGSLDAVEYRAALLALTGVILDSILSSTRPRELSICLWSQAGDLQRAPSVKVTLPAWHNDCVDSEVVAGTEAIYANRVAEIQADLDLKYDNCISEKDSLWRLQINSRLAGIRERMSSVADTCCAPNTSFYDALIYAADESREALVIIISDAEPVDQDLPPAALARQAGLRDRECVLILVPSKSDMGAEEVAEILQQRELTLARVAPWLRVIRSRSIDDLLTEFATSGRLGAPAVN